MPHGITIGEQTTLGALIDNVERALKSTDDPDAMEVRFDFCYLAPQGLSSYRGYYEDLAIHWGDETRLAKDFLSGLKEAVGKTFHGWKGGNYTMSLNTPLWVANRGDTGDTAVIGTRISSVGVLILKTDQVDG